MQATVDIPQLKSALGTVKPAIARRHALPVLSGARLDVTRGLMAITATDLDLTIRTTVPATVGVNGAAILPFKLLTQLLHGKGQIELSLNDDGQMVAKNGSVSKLQPLPLEEYPRLTDDSLFVDQHQVDVAAIGRVLAAASSEDSRPILTGVLFDGEEIVATDSYRLHRAVQPGAAFPRVLIPARALDAIVAAARKLKASSVTMLLPKAVEVKCTSSGGYRESAYTCVNGRHTKTQGSEDIGECPRCHGTGTVFGGPYNAQFRIEGSPASWTTRLIEGEFPNYSSLIPGSYPNVAVVDRDALVDGIKQVKTFVRDTTTPVRLHFDPASSTMTAVVDTQDVGTAEATVDVKYEGVKLTVAFNPEYLIDCLMAGGSVARIETVDALKPGVISDGGVGRDGKRGDVAILMPVRVP